MTYEKIHINITGGTDVIIYYTDNLVHSNGIMHYIRKQVAQRATIAHLSPMCQVKSHLKLAWRHHFPIITLWNIFQTLKGQ